MSIFWIFASHLHGLVCDCVISLIILTHILGKIFLCTFYFDQLFNVAVEQQLCELRVNIGGAVSHSDVLFQKIIRCVAYQILR